MKTRMLFSFLLATLLVCAVCEAQPQVFTVDCNSGQTITQALKAHPGIVPITIVATGQCNENVLIDRDDVTLRTVSWPIFISPATVNGTDSTKATITVAAARATIDGLTVTGGRRGITVLGSATIKNCTVQNTGPIGVISSGISFYHGGQGTVDKCTIKNNRSFGIAIEGGSATVTNSTIAENTDAGIAVSLSGSARIGLTDDMVYAKNKIQNNASNGIMINAGGSAFIGGNTIEGNGTTTGHRFGQYGIAIYQATAILVGANSISNNRGSGIFARGSAVLIGDPTFGLDSANKINDNGVGVGVSTKGGIFGFLGSSLEIQNATIEHNTGDGVTLSTRSTARMFVNNKITRNTENGILLEAGGGLLLPASTTTVTANTLFGLQCTDAESSFAGKTEGITGNTGGQVSPSCTGF
jgi:parallel beta-helix repeat protein